LEVKRTSRGPEIVVSRSHPLMLRRLLELEVPEIRAGQVEIKAVAREAGTRAKVAVAARQPGLDPVGACVGMRGIRIQTISNELHGERVDVVEWDKDPKAFISNALSMKQVISVVLDDNNPGGRTASVVVLDDQLSLAIGRSGQNARLAAKLTNSRVDIQGVTEAAMWALEQVNASPELLDSLKSAATLIPRLASIMRTHEENHYPYNDEEVRIIKTVAEAVREAMIARRDAERPATRQARARRTAQEKVEADRLAAKQVARASVPEAAYTQAIDALGFSDKVHSHLMSNGITNVGEVMERIALGDEALLMLEGIGVKALKEIKDAVTASEWEYVEPGAEAVVPSEEMSIESVAEGEAAEDTTEDAALSTTAPTIEAPIAEEAIDEAVASDELMAVVESVPDTDVKDEVVAAPEVAAETASEADAASEEAVFAPEAITEIIEDFTEAFGDDDTFDDDGPKGRRGKKKGRTVVFDDKTGETFVVRKRRRRQKDIWQDFGDEL
jgi:N utilization substance protein A